MVDNNATQKHPEVDAWLAKNPGIGLHFTPTSASWLNLVEVFIGIFTRRAIRRGNFRSVADLIAEIRYFIDGWNDRCPRSCGPRSAAAIVSHARQGTSNERYCQEARIRRRR